MNNIILLDYIMDPKCGFFNFTITNLNISKIVCFIDRDNSPASLMKIKTFTSMIMLQNAAKAEIGLLVLAIKSRLF